MKTQSPSDEVRILQHETLSADLVVVGGGLAGTCAAISAAREGNRVVLVQDRPVLGGNGSSEVRLWWLGATCHAKTNNRWAREAGLINEFLLENLYRNPEGNPEFVDVVLLDAARREKNLTLLLNTAVHGLKKKDAETIHSVSAFCSQNSTSYTLEAPLFCDASGDGIVGFMAGAAFRMGAETKEEFDEALATDESFGELLGDTIYFYTKDAGQPVKFHPPSFAKKLSPEKIRMLQFYNLSQQGCQLWWVEVGGRYDTVHQAEAIKWELWEIVYGLWDYIKNSGKYPDSETMTLEWVGKIPGKREARRFEGDYLLKQDDVVHARQHPDAVGFGGWAIDLHPADGIFSDQPSAIQYLSRSLYPIPYRCLYSRNITNLFLGGRTMSATHVAFGSTRVMCTLGQLGEAIGAAAAQCRREGCLPCEVEMPLLQRTLHRRGFHLPLTTIVDEEDLAQGASVAASSVWQPQELVANGEWIKLEKAQCQLLPLGAGPLPKVTVPVKATNVTSLVVEWRVPSLQESQTPDQLLERREFRVPTGESRVEIFSEALLPKEGYAYLIFQENAELEVALTEQRATGLIRLQHHGEQRNGDCHQQYLSTEEAGCEAFELWFPERRPKGKNLALSMERSLVGYGAENVQTMWLRPSERPHAWVADPADAQPELTFVWASPQTVQRVCVFLDPDWDHPVESVILEHPEQVMPSLAAELKLLNEQGETLGHVTENHSNRVEFSFSTPLTVSSLKLQIGQMNGPWPAAVFGVRMYAT